MFGTLNDFRRALGLYIPVERRTKPRKKLHTVMARVYEYLCERHGQWQVQRQYQYTDSFTSFPLALKIDGKKTELIEFIDATSPEELKREITRLERKHRMITDPTAFYSLNYSVWVININHDQSLNKFVKLQDRWTVISTEDFRNLFKE